MSIRSTSPRLAALVGLSAIMAGCPDVAEDRARRDSRIGRAETTALRVGVAEGHARIREIGDGALTLWAQAPSLRVRLEASEPGEWTLVLRNAVADAELCLTRPSGDVGCLEPIEVPRPTEKHWRLSLDESGVHTVEIAPPDADRRAPWSFVVFADVQEHIGAVQDIYRRMAAVTDVRFGLISGDLTEQGSPAQLRRFQREMQTLPFPLFATIGNHELGTRDDLFHDYFGRGNSSFAFRGVRFTLLDSASATIAPRVYGWLDDWLARGAGGLHLAMMHIPPLDPAGLRNGAFASRAEANKLLSTLSRGGVDLTIYGHVHSYYAFTNAGIEAHISGGGGAIPERLDGIGRHFLLIRADPDEQTFTTSVIRVFPAQ